MLFNEPKLLKFNFHQPFRNVVFGFSALQRAEIAEIVTVNVDALLADCFSALQRAEIAEIQPRRHQPRAPERFSALQRAEIAEILDELLRILELFVFQCSSTSRNC